MKLINYKKSIALIGDSKHLRDAIMEAKLGIWVKGLEVDNKKVSGWIFKPEKQHDIESLLLGQECELCISNPTTTTPRLIEQKSLAKKSEPVALATNAYSKQLLENYLMANLSILLDVIGAEMKIGSIISNDLSLLPDDGKKYLFLGGGCGFSWIVCDKRNRKAVQMIEDSQVLKKKIDIELVKCIDTTYLKKLEDSGNPIQAHLSQNLNYKSAYNGLCMRLFHQFLPASAKLSMRNHDD